MMVRANQLEFAGDEMEEGMNYYDEESLSLCGVEGFSAGRGGLPQFRAAEVNKSGGTGSSRQSR